MTPDLWARVRPALDKAIGLSDVQRMQFLSELEREDSQVYGEVQSLLLLEESASHVQLDAAPETLMNQVLQEHCLPPADADGRTNVESTSNDTVAPGTHPNPMANFRIDGIVGQGGMGVVLSCRDPAFKRMLAVKVLLPEHRGHAGMVSRFFQEAVIMGRLEHPGIPPVHSLSDRHSACPYFTMKLIHGQTLTALLKDRQHDPPDGHLVETQANNDLPRFLSIFTQLCQTIAYVHSQGVLHRDLKPGNIMVGAFGEVQVMDWGLARIGSAWEAEPGVRDGENGQRMALVADANHLSQDTDHQTQAGSVFGTPAYMAPEQARGEIEQLDERCDVFALGAILCEILTGKPAFTSETMWDMISHAQQGDLSDAFMRLDSCGADDDVVQLAVRCLQPLQQDRPRHAGEVAQAMESYQARVQERLQQAEIDTATAQARADEERKRRRVSVAFAAAVVLLILGGTGASLAYFADQAQRTAEDARREAVTQERKRQLNSEIATALDEAEQQRADLLRRLADPRKASLLLSDIDSWKSAERSATEYWKRGNLLLNTNRDLIDPDVISRLQNLGQQLKDDKSDLQVAVQLDAVRQEIASQSNVKAIVRKVLPEYVRIFGRLGSNLVKDEPVQLAGRVRDSHIRFALVAALDQMASLGAADSEPTRRLLEIARGADPDPWRNQFRDPRVWSNREELERLASSVQPDSQTPQILDALAFRLHVSGGDALPLLRRALLHHPDDFWLHFRIGSMTSDSAEAAGAYRAALAVRPNSSAANNNLGNSYFRQGLLEPAREHWEKALDLNPQNRLAHFNLGLACASQNKLTEAAEHFEQALKVHPEDADVHFQLGRVLFRKYELANAIACFRKAIVLDAKFARAHAQLGDCLLLTRDLAEAAVHLREAVELSPSDAVYHAGLTNARLQQGQVAMALQAAVRAEGLLSKDHAARQMIKSLRTKCDRMLALEKKLPGMLDGTSLPRNTEERLRFAELCCYKDYCLAAARFYKDVFEQVPDLADNVLEGHRYQAATVAVRAASGQARDANGLSGEQSRRWREQARIWLAAELNALEKLAGQETSRTSESVARRLVIWQNDPSLAGIREDAALEKLDVAEQQAWRRIGSGASELLEKLKK